MVQVKEAASSFCREVPPELIRSSYSCHLTMNDASREGGRRCSEWGQAETLKRAQAVGCPVG